MPDIALWPSCDHRCTMCSNEHDYKFTSKDYTFANIKQRIDKFADGDQTQFYRFADLKDDWTITGGEPTLNPDYFHILEYIREKFPNSKLVQLTHGDNFSDEEFTKKIATIENYHLVFPIHGYSKKTHEEIVRKKRSWELLLKGIDNVLRYKKSNNQTLELRIIIQGQNYKHLDKIYELINKYFPRVDSVVSIMMEYEGQAIDNISMTKVNYYDVLALNEDIFLKWGNIFGKEKFKLYHFPLCTIQNKELWKYTWRTLPPDEIEFLDICNTCELRKYCMGIHENYCKFNGESEIKSFQQKDIFGFQIIENEENLRFHPIKEVKKDNSPRKKTVIFTGYACNNICRFCIDLNKREINRTTKEILKDILIAKKNGTQILEIIGGEVTIRRDFFVIMEFIRFMKFEHVYLVTNGNRLADFDFAKKFYDLGVIHSIVFSIHGHTEKLHDLLTATPGSFKKLLKGIKNWQDLGFSKNKIGTNTAIENGNYESLEEIGRLVKKLGCLGSSEFIFADPNQGGVNNEFEKLMPKISKAAPYMRKLLDWGNKNSMVYRVRYVPLCYFQEYMENNISELKEIEIYSNVTHSAPDFYNSDVVEGRKNSGRIKTKKCEGCRLFNTCEGIWKTYYEKLGDTELLPLKYILYEK